MLRVAALLVLLSGCATVRPAARPDAAPDSVRVDPPVMSGVVVGPEAITQFIASDGLIREWDAWVRGDGIQLTVHVGPVDSSAWGLTLYSGALNDETGEYGQLVAGRPSRVDRGRTMVRVGPDREVIATGDVAAAFARVDFDGLAAAAARDTAFVHPRTQAVRFGRQAAERYARSARLVAGSAVFPAQLAALLPDTTGLDVTVGARTRTEWTEANTEWTWDDWLPPDLDRPEESSVASLTVSLEGGGGASVALADVPHGVLGAADRALADGVEAFPVSPAGGPFRWTPMRFGGSGAVVRVGERRWALGSGSDTTFVAALLRRVNVAALASLVPRPTWRAARPEEVSEETESTAGLVETGDRVHVAYPGDEEWRSAQREALPLSFQIPPGWLATSTLGLACGYVGDGWWATYALLSRTPVDPCRTRSGYDAARSAAVVEIREIIPMDAASVPWLVSWLGYAASLLQPWTSSFETTRVPAPNADGTVTIALTGPDLAVDVAFVPVGAWLVGVVGAGPHADADALRETVAAVARSLQPGP